MSVPLRRLSRNSLTGLSGLQHAEAGQVSPAVLGESQSPYGAKWFATIAHEVVGRWGAIYGRNPLTGLSGLQREGRRCEMLNVKECRNPLTGLSGLQPEDLPLEGEGGLFQSRNPLTGLSGLQLTPAELQAVARFLVNVAIPLRG